MKKQKTLECKECGNKYTSHNAWLEKHVKKLGHWKFKEIGDQALKLNMEGGLQNGI